MRTVPMLTVAAVNCATLMLSGCSATGQRWYLYNTQIVDTGDMHGLQVQIVENKDHVLYEEHIVQQRPANLPFSAEYRSGTVTPQRCLALSGGGMRSAAFSMGVLAAFDEKHQLPQFDLISGVSGGAYTLSWFYVQQYNVSTYLDRNPDDSVSGPDNFSSIRACTRSGGNRNECIQHALFAKDGDFHKILLENSRLLTEQQALALLAHNSMALAQKTYYNGLFDRHQAIGKVQQFYPERLRTIFYQSPHGISSDPSMYQLGAFSVRAGLPSFVFNTTAWLGSDDSADLTLHDSVFSFGPLQYGSRGYGYYRYPDDDVSTGRSLERDPIRVSEVIARSGSAFDSNEVTRNVMVRAISSALSPNLGAYIKNPAISDTVRQEHDSKIFPFYLPKHRDLRDTGIYLTDGGHVDNLGVYSLVARGCSDITIVDAEHDPTYIFESYRRLKTRLYEELYPSTLAVDSIDGSSQIADPEGSRAWENAKVDPSLGIRWKYFAGTPVMDGILQLRGAGRNKDIAIHYVKLAYKPETDLSDPVCAESKCEMLHDPGTHAPVKFNDNWASSTHECQPVNPAYTYIDNYYYCIKQERRIKPYLLGTPAPFPQQPTTDQNYSDMQFEAYFELGQVTGRRLIAKERK